GPLARSVADVALLAAVAGVDFGAAGAWQAPRTRLALRVGIDPDYCSDDLAAPLAERLAEAATVLRAAGATLVPVVVPRLAATGDDWLTLTAHAAATAHAATYPARAVDYGPALSALLDYGRSRTPADVTRADHRVAAYARDFDALFARVDVVLSPVLHGPTPSAVEAIGAMRGDGVRRLVAFTAPANLSGCPSLSLPAGRDTRGVPWGYQLLGRRGGEASLCDAGHTLEQAHPWPRVAPAWAGMG
ncbi:MAG: amidase family protein, partial [Gammaproteobacteria bacterium]